MVSRGGEKRRPQSRSDPLGAPRAHQRLFSYAMSTNCLYFSSGSPSRGRAGSLGGQFASHDCLQASLEPRGGRRESTSACVKLLWLISCRCEARVQGGGRACEVGTQGHAGMICG